MSPTYFAIDIKIDADKVFTELSYTWSRKNQFNAIVLVLIFAYQSISLYKR